MNTITLITWGVVISLFGGVISLFSTEHGFMKGKHWIACGLGSLLIGWAAVRILATGTVVQDQLWEILPGIPISITIDPLSAFFILVLCVVFVPVCLFASAYYRWKQILRIHGALFACFFLSLVTVLIADNSWFFLVAWEVMSLLSFGLVVYEHQHEHVRRAGFIYLTMTHLGTLFLMIAFTLIYCWSGSIHFSDWAIHGAKLDTWRQNLVFGLVLIGFGTKAGMVPFHVWLPRAHPVAPGPVSSLMSAVMVKVGLYGLLRVVWDWFDGGQLWWGAVLLAAGLVTALMGALYLVIKDELKQLLAYSSVENMGILLMALGVASMSSAQADKSLTILAFAALFLHILNHALFKSLLFLISGSVQHGTGTVQFNQLGGLLKRMPYTGSFFLIGAAALAAVPLLNGFVGEWLLFQSLIGGVLHWSIEWKALGMISVAGLGMVGALTASGMVKSFGTAFLGKPRSRRAAEAYESPRIMRLGMALLAVGVVLGGLLPGTIWTWINPALSQWFPQRISDALPVLQDWTMRNLPENPTHPVLSLLLLAVMMIVVVVSLLVVIRMTYGASRVTQNESWGCGQRLTERMEYSATSLSYPLMMFFHSFYQSKLTKEADGPRYVHKIKVDLRIKQLIEVFLYLPAFKTTIYLSGKIREIQNGRLQLYLAYILITLLILLITQIR